eukprot:6205050-Pleurochrysis_carterae.AAC.1
MMTAVAVDCLFVHGIHRRLCPPGIHFRQGSAFVRPDTHAAYAIIPPITFTFEATAPMAACVPKLKVEADTISLPSDGIFRLDDAVEYDQTSQVAMQIFLATLLHRMPSACLASLTAAQRHQINGLARRAESAT